MKTSVVITTKNRLMLLKRALASVWAQTHTELEVVVVDDGSDDGTGAYLQCLAKTRPNLRVISNGQSLGACAARNLGIEHARGEFIAGLDDDDQFTPDRLTRLLGAYRDQFAFVTGNTRVIGPRGSKRLFRRERTLALSDMFWHNVVGTQVLTKRQRLLEVGGFDARLSSAQDLDLWVRLIERYGPAKRLAEVLYLLHTEHDLPRISTGKSKPDGMRQYLNKHRSRMSPAQQHYYQTKASAWEHGSYWPLLSLARNPSTARFYAQRALGCL